MKMPIRKILLAIAAASLLAISPAMAFYTECVVTKDTSLSIRPSGPTEPRYQPVNKGDKVAFRASYQGWWFVMHAIQADDSWITDYGWLPQSVLTNCKPQDGTP